MEHLANPSVPSNEGATLVEITSPTDFPMSLVLSFTSAALVLAVALLVRERRLRRALERLLQKLLAHWRNHATQNCDRPDRSEHPGD